MAGQNENGAIVPSPLPGPDYRLPDPSQAFQFSPAPNQPVTIPTGVGGHLVASGNSQNAPAAVTAAGGDDRDNTDVVPWYVFEHQSTADVLNTANNNNLRVVDLFVETPGANAVLTATFVANSGSYARGWAFLVNVDTTTLLNYVVANNMRIISQKVFYDAGQSDPNNRVRFYAVMISNTGADAKTWFFYKDQTTSQLTSLWEANSARITQVNSYMEGATKLYDAVMIANGGTDSRAWEWWVDASISFINGRLSATGSRIVDLDIDSNTGNYNVILNSCPGGCPLWWWYVGVATSDLLNLSNQLGARMIDVNSTAGCNDRCWSVVLINNSNAITSRVGQILRGTTDGTVGLYLKQVNGPLLANLMDATLFEPASTIKAFVHLYTLRSIQAGTVTSARLINRYAPPVTGSCPGNTVNGTEAIDLADREMMWHSDNTRTRELSDFFGAANVNTMASNLGMGNTKINHIIGCGGPVPDTTTLDDLGRLYENVANNSFVNPYYRAYFFRQEAGKYEYKVEGYDWTGLWSTDIPAMISQEAPLSMNAAQRAAYREQMELAYKAGNYKICGVTCATYVDHISIAGYAKIPFCDVGGAREFVFGIYIYNATSDTASSAAFNAAKAELLREQIHDGMASCAGTNFIKTYMPVVLH